VGLCGAAQLRFYRGDPPIASDERHDITDAHDAADMADRPLANDPIDRIERAEPMLPMLSTEPTDPMDSRELVLPIDSSELREYRLQREVVCAMSVSMHASCHVRCEHVTAMDVTRDRLFDEYDTTIVSVLHPQVGWTDPALVAIETRRSAVVMTAWNPGFVRPSLAENREANARLRTVLDATGHEVWRADGRAPDGTELEEGWIVWELPVSVGLAVAASFGQFAIYAYDESGLRVTVACPS
jgi:hypothetical protein